MTSAHRLRRLPLATALALVVALVGARSAFALSAPTGLAYNDLVAGAEIFDPQFTWNAVSGAAGYEIEVNSSSAWASGSKVCCSALSFGSTITTYGTSYSPLVVLANNTYYWRVRAIDASGNAGPWSAGPSFDKTFDNVTPSVVNLRLADSDLNQIATGSAVDTPIVLWDQVPGASSYQVGVTPLNTSTNQCDWAAATSIRWDSNTATAAWTPLGWSRGIGADPLQWTRPPTDDFLTGLIAGDSYCVRVRPVDKASTSSGPVVAGDWTYLPAPNQAAFVWNGPATSADGDCSPCQAQASDYIEPVFGATTAGMPVFTWAPMTGAESYFVVVARDAQFTNIVDYAYTRVAAYAPRTHTITKGYSDETTSYYWAVLPADEVDGHGVSSDAASSNPQAFVKQAGSPTQLSPLNGASTGLATVFKWTPVLGARRYRVQVADDPTFANIYSEGGSFLSGALTDSTAYTSSTAYPTGKTLYWRVQAEAEDGSQFVGLSWSTTGTFTRSSTASSLKQFRLSAVGYPVKGQYRTIKIYVKNRATGKAVYRAKVVASGAGVQTTTRYSSRKGIAKFYLKATKLGKVTFRVSKTGFLTGSIYRTVRTG